MRNMRRWPVVLLLAAVLFSCSRAGVSPGGISVESQTDASEAGIVYRLGDTDVTLGVPASTEVSLEEHNVIRVYIREDEAGEVDLSGLGALSDAFRLTLTAEGNMDALILPPNIAGTVIEAGTIRALDASRCRLARPLELRCHVEEADMPPTLEALTVSDDSLFRFPEMPRLYHVGFLHPVDLSPLAGLFLTEEQRVVYVTRSPEDGPWDLSPLADADITLLNLGDTITQEEADTLNGGTFTGLEMSDEVIRSLAFLERLPAVSSLLLTVKGEQPEEVLPYLSTMTACTADVLDALDTEISRDELAAFAERGDVYLFFDARR